MIAMKREVATQDVGFPWSECQVRETGDKSLYKTIELETGISVRIRIK